MTFTPQYLHAVGPGVFYLDHRLNPAVRAMFAAMSSRMPKGGITARYTQIVETIAEERWAQARVEAAQGDGYENKKHLPTWEKIQEQPMYAFAVGTTWQQAEELLCEEAIHPRIRNPKFDPSTYDRAAGVDANGEKPGFFDTFVLMYGHSSILELTGSPAVFTENISWYTAYLLFDDPLNIGQEFSTRAVRHKDWPMARECYAKDTEQGFLSDFHTEEEVAAAPWGDPTFTPHPVLKGLHEDWFEVFEAEVDAWKTYLSDADVRASLGIADKEPFRPALDRARCTIPGTISTGCCHTGNVRTRSRILRDGLLLAQRGKALAPIQVWEGIREGYRQAMPALADMGLREAVYGDSSRIPVHMNVLDVEDRPEDVVVKLHLTKNFLHPLTDSRPQGQRSYLDPIWNQIGRVDITFDCSLAVSRDWHRHRTMYPWSLDLVRDADGLIQLHHMYELKSDIGKAKVKDLLKRSTEAFDAFMKEGNQMQAMLCLPLGTKVRMSGQAGLRDAVYMLELRAHAAGANFEYKDQALRAIDLLVEQLAASGIFGGSPIPIDVLTAMGLERSAEA